MEKWFVINKGADFAGIAKRFWDKSGYGKADPESWGYGG